MHKIFFTSGIILLMCACNQPAAVSTTAAASDLAQENMKESITQVETDVYKVDSTGKTGPLDEKDIETYDSSGYDVSYVSKNGKDSVTTESKFTHNPAGFMLNMETTDGNGKPKSSMTIDYDSAGKYSLAKSYDSSGKMDVYYVDIAEGPFGQVLSAKGYHADSTLKMSFTNNFDSVYYVGGESKDSVGKTTYSSKVTLNDKKDDSVVAEMTVTTDPKTKKDSTTNTVTTYTYDAWDDHGNWTQRTSLNEKGKATKIEKRIITYKQ